MQEHGLHAIAYILRQMVMVRATVSQFGMGIAELWHMVCPEWEDGNRRSRWLGTFHKSNAAWTIQKQCNRAAVAIDQAKPSMAMPGRQHLAPHALGRHT